MAGSVAVDLESTEQCKATSMIEFLFSFCTSESNERVPVCNKRSLNQAFEETRKIAKRSGTPLQTRLAEL